MIESTWSEQFRAAFHTSARHFKAEDVDDFRGLADRMSRVLSTTEREMDDLAGMEELPNDPEIRRRAYVALVALGYDPTDGFGLSHDDRGVDLTPDELRRFLDPGVAT